MIDAIQPDEEQGGNANTTTTAAEATGNAADSPPAITGVASPVTGAERIASIDVLRGLALCGVLLMNMQSFAMPLCAYMNPTSYGDQTRLNFALWCLNYVFADGKFVTIFSMLFGAGIVLMTSRAKARTSRTFSVHYRRMLWMAMFGCLHGIFLWYGDILLAYAICGMVAYWFRRARPRLLIIVGAVFICIPFILLFGFPQYMKSESPEELQKMMDMWSPSAEIITAEITAYRGSYLVHLPARFESWVEFFSFLFIFGWRILGVMLLGMAMFKTGVIAAEKSNRFYVTLIIGGFGFGLPLSGYGIHYMSANDWEVLASMGPGSLFNYVGSLFSAFAWIGVVMLACRSNWLPGLRRRLSAVGRMAFTNYIMHSVLCTTLFYGHGFGLFGRLDRLGQLCVVLAIVVLQLWYSPLWLGRFRFGPLEWCWRSLTYWRRQPFRRLSTS